MGRDGKGKGQGKGIEIRETDRYEGERGAMRQKIDSNFLSENTCTCEDQPTCEWDL